MTLAQGRISSLALAALCLHSSCCLFCDAVARKGGNMQGADHSLQHPCKHLKESSKENQHFEVPLVFPEMFLNKKFSFLPVVFRK